MDVRRTARRLADGRQIIYFDDRLEAATRDAFDGRPLTPEMPRSELRRDPLTGERVVIAPHRQHRTYHPPEQSCPLCPSRPGRPTEIPEPDYDVAVFDNRFPAFGPDQRGHCEMVCFTATHDHCFADLSPARVQTVLAAWADRTAALGALAGVEQVYCFENRGAEMGVTLSHPHGQIYGYPFVTPPTERELSRAAEHHAATGRHLMADVLAAAHADGTRVLHRGAHWTALVPIAAKWPVHLQLVPHRRVPDLPALDPAERAEFASLYLDVLARLDRLYGRPLPYIAGWHQAPARRGRELAWLRLEICSIQRTSDKTKYVAGTESLMAVWVNDRTPEQIAEQLRTA